jgi:predicted MPP superfamily phosphohydrolase
VRKPKKFGRARHASLKHKAVDLALGVLYAGGWPAVLTNAMGLQGELEVAEHVFHIPRSRNAAPVLRLAFASDFHAGPTLHPRLLREALGALERSRPDLLLLGGDFVSFHARYVDDLLEGLRAVRAPLGKFAVLGNHDLLGDDEHIVTRLAEAGILTLVNSNVRLPAPHDDVWICGLDDWNEGAPDAAATVKGAEGTRILLMHQPDGLMEMKEHRYDIAFCGHVHGGQYLKRNGAPAIRHKGPISTLYMHGGVFHVGVNNAPVLVSRGIGTSTLPARRRADPQVHVCRLVPQER